MNIFISKSLLVTGFLIPAILTGCSGGAVQMPTGIVDSGRCERLSIQYRRYSTDNSQQQRPGLGYYEIGTERCRTGNYPEGVLYLQRAVRATGFEPAE